MTCIHRRNARRLRAFRAANAAPSLLATAMAVASVLPGYPAYAAPVGGTIIDGAASINVGTSTTINQTTPRVAINWNSFSSAAGETINFIQKPTDIALNRVTGTSASQLMGTLTATGQVFILNPNGVLFGTGSQVNVGGLLASTLDMNKDDFMKGTYALQGSSKERVVNQGIITTTAAGGYVALVGPAVVNDGVILVNKGDALLAAGDKVTLRVEGGGLLGYSMDLGSANALVDNTANGVVSANGGRVAMEARAGEALSKAAVNQRGVVEAQTLESRAGSIRLTASGAGEILVTGSLDASAPTGGSGGSIATAGARVTITDSARITAAANVGPNVFPGTLKIDSNDIDIVSANGAQTGSSINAATLATALNTTNVFITSTASGAGNSRGDINVKGDLAWRGGALILTADQNIQFNASLKGNKLNLQYGQSTTDGGNADFYLNNGGKIDLYPSASILDGFFITRKGLNGTNKAYEIISSLGVPGNTPAQGTLQGAFSAGNTKNYVLGSDIDASATRTSNWNAGAGFTPLGEFVGTFEGLGHKISDLSITTPAGSVLGLFSNIRSDALVRNLGITGATVVGNEAVGILAGTSFGAIHNVYVTGKASGTRRTGGLVGINSGTISSSHSEAIVEGNRIAGGLVGENAAGVISNSYASGAVSAGNPTAPADPEGPGYAGGLVGFNRARITGSYASGTTAGPVAVGGLVGGNMGIIDNSYATGAVNGNTWVGGLVGKAITGTDIKNAYAAGVVTGISSVGGLVGVAETQTQITNTYATGTVKGKDSTTTRGLVGETADGVVAGSYWNTDTEGGTGQKLPGAGIGITGAQLQQAATFSGWDIATTGGTEKVWRIYEGHSKPLLRSFLAPLVLGSSPSLVYDGTGRFNPAIPTTGARTGTAASGRNVGTYQPYSNQQGYDISNGELVITKRPLEIDAQVTTRVYNGEKDAQATLSSKQIVDEGLVINGVATFDDKNAGTGKKVAVTAITLDGTNAGNYSFQSVVDATGNVTPLELGLKLSASDKGYDGTTAAVASVLYSKLGNDDLNANFTANFDNKNAGGGKTVFLKDFTLTGNDAANYTFTLPGTTTASIAKRPLAITATAADKVYDGTTLARPTLQDNRVAGDALVTNAVASFDDKNAGAAKKVTVSGITVAGADAGNYLYQPQTSTTSARITPRPLAITATAADKPYDGTTQTSATLSNNRLTGDAVTASYQRADFADKNGGQQKTVTVSGIALGGADAPNYQANSSTTTTASITPIPLTTTANPATKPADGVPYQGGNGVSYAGFLPGENATVLDGTLRYGGDAQRAIKAGQYRITPGGLASVNYASTFVDGTLTIQPLPPGAGQIASYIESSVRAPLALAGGKPGGTALSGVECGMRMPENLLFGECQSAPQPGGPTR